jgi:hypothetical protein
MIMGHQQSLLNLISSAVYQTNSALALKSHNSHRAPLGHLSSNTETTDEVIRRVCEPVVAGLLFAGEAKLNGAISGESGFAQHFSSMGSKDRLGRSLRTLDLNRRLFKYPCSYLIYSENFSALPSAAKRYVYRRLWDVLTGKYASGRFSRLTRADRKDIREILIDTVPGFAPTRR